MEKPNSVVLNQDPQEAGGLWARVPQLQMYTQHISNTAEWLAHKYHLFIIGTIP